MDVSKEVAYILYKTEYGSDEKVIKGIFKSASKANNFKWYLEKRNRIKITKNENVSKYIVERARIYLDLTQ